MLEVTFHRYESKTVLLLFFEASLLPDSPEPRARDVAAGRGAARHELDTLPLPPADVAIVKRVQKLL